MIGERGKRLPSGEIAEGVSDPSESTEASSGLQWQQGRLRRLRLRGSREPAQGRAPADEGSGRNLHLKAEADAGAQPRRAQFTPGTGV